MVDFLDKVPYNQDPRWLSGLSLGLLILQPRRPARGEIFSTVNGVPLLFILIHQEDQWDVMSREYYYIKYSNLDSWMDERLVVLRPFQQYFSHIKAMSG